MTGASAAGPRKKWVRNSVDNARSSKTSPHHIVKHILTTGRLCSIYQYSNMTPRLSEQTSVFFVSKSLLEIERQKKLEKFAFLTRKPRSQVRILIYRTWSVGTNNTRREHKTYFMLSSVFMPKTKLTDFQQFRVVLQIYLSFSKLEISPQNRYLDRYVSFHCLQPL